jgi:outer membrane protein assembly factor BamB
MTTQNDYFTPEQVDEQIEHLWKLNTPHEQADEAQLVAVLQRHYRVSLGAHDRAALAHAQQRILDGLSNDVLLDHETPFVKGSADHPLVQPGRTRLPRLVSSLAAVLVTGALLVSWLVVTHLAKTPPRGVSSAGQSSLYHIHSGVAYRLDGNTGATMWQHPVPTKKQSDPNHGGSASLQVSNSVVYVVLDFDIYALDARDGHQIWHVTNRGTAEYFSFVVDHGRFYLFSLDNTFSALDASNGTPLWHNTTFTTQNGSGFRVLNGSLYTETSGPTARDHALWALDGATGKVRWSYPLSYGSFDPLVADGVVYFFSGGIVTAVKEQNGDKIWERSVSAVGGGMLYIADDVLYVNGRDLAGYAVYALSAHNGQILWTSAPEFSVFPLPITGGLLLAQQQHNGNLSIAGLDARTGKVGWQAPLPCNAVRRNPERPQEVIPSCTVSWSAVIDGNWYLLVSDSGEGPQGMYIIKRVDPRTGQLLSEHPLASRQDNLGVIGASNGLLFAALGVPRTANNIPYDDTIFVAYHLENATQAWDHVMPPFPAPQGANTSPNTSETVLVP